MLWIVVMMCSTIIGYDYTDIVTDKTSDKVTVLLFDSNLDR